MTRGDDTAIGTLNNEPSTRDLSRHNVPMQFKGIDSRATDMAEVILVDHDDHLVVVKDRWGATPRTIKSDDHDVPLFFSHLRARAKHTSVLVVHHSLVDSPHGGGKL